MSELLINLLANTIWLLTGVLLTKGLNFFRITRPIKNLWQIENIEQLIISTANSVKTDTGKYRRPATGIGQVRALTHVMESLNKAYGKLTVQNIYLSTDQLYERLENDLVLLGGGKNNQLSANFLDSVKDKQPIIQVGNGFVWRIQAKKKWTEVKAEEFYGEVQNSKVVRDFGVIIRATNPFTSKKRKVILFAGSHTYGTVAASKYFVDSVLNELGYSTLKNSNIALIVSAMIIDEYPTNIKLEKSFTWETG